METLGTLLPRLLSEIKRRNRNAIIFIKRPLSLISSFGLPVCVRLLSNVHLHLRCKASSGGHGSEGMAAFSLHESIIIYISEANNADASCWGKKQFNASHVLRSHNQRQKAPRPVLGNQIDLVQLLHLLLRLCVFSFFRLRRLSLFISAFIWGQSQRSRFGVSFFICLFYRSPHAPFRHV